MKRFFQSLTVLPSLIFSFAAPVLAQPVASVPTVVQRYGEWRVLVPNWQSINFSTLPPIESSGSIKIPEDIVQRLGYDPSRSWVAGQTPDQFLMLGDVAEAFNLQLLNLQQIFQSLGLKLDIKKINLKEFQLLQWQTAASLLRAIPELGELYVSQVPPLQEIALKLGLGDEIPISVLAANNPTFANTPLKEIDLEKFSLDSIPGVASTPLQNFQGWEASFVAGVPNLAKLPFSSFPTPPSISLSAVAIADLPWSTAEYREPRVSSDQFISGSDRVGFHVPCELGKPCSYLELSDFMGQYGPLYGKRWVSGYSQQVKGGYGILGQINNGKEPTGRLVFGPGFKVVLTKINESKGTAEFGLYFRFCMRSLFADLGCTPYFIGPVPWIPVKEKDLVIVDTGVAL
jgi:hypothetical protein